MLGCTGLIGIVYLVALYKVLLLDEKREVPQQLKDHENEPTSRREHQEQKPPKPEGDINSDSDRVTIGYAVTVTGCGSDPITEGAAVLEHSIHLASVNGRYDYQMYAIYHPDGAACAAPLADLGYKLLERETPVQVKDIEGDFLRQNIEKNGCCGEKELVKLEAYTLTQHPIVALSTKWTGISATLLKSWMRLKMC